MMIKFTWISWFNLVVDTCFHYKHLNETNRKNNYKTPLKFVLCDKQLQEGWYRFVGAAGTKMPTTRVPAFRCGTNWSAGWMVLILQWKMVWLPRRSALVIVIPVANTGQRFMWKIVNSTSSTNFAQLLVTRATVVQTEHEAHDSTQKHVW